MTLKPGTDIRQLIGELGMQGVVSTTYQEVDPDVEDVFMKKMK